MISSKKILVAILLLAFMCQGFAMVAMKCEQHEAPSLNTSVNAMMHSDSMTEHMHHDMGVMTLSEMHDQMDSELHSEINKADCCKSMGHCLLSGCVFTATGDASHFSYIASKTYTLDLYAEWLPTPITFSLYRPPISC